MDRGKIPEPDEGRLSRIVKSLEAVRDMLARTNSLNGAMARYESMKREIEEIGWDGICAKYHPDINMDDPAAYELFLFYKYVHESMDRDTNI